MAQAPWGCHPMCDSGGGSPGVAGAGGGGSLSVQLGQEGNC